MVRERLDGLEAELGHHVAEALRPGVVAAHEGQEVPPDLDRVAGVGEEDRHEVFVERPLASQPHVGDPHPLLEDGLRFGGEPAPADVDDVARGREERDRLSVEAGRRHDHEVEEVPRPEPRVVGHEDVARPHRLDREPREKVLHRPGHRVDVPRGPGHRLGDHAAPQVVDPARKVPRFPDDGAECGAKDRLGLLLDDRDEPIPHHLPVDRVDGGIRSFGSGHGQTALPARLSMTMYSNELSAALNPAGTKVAVSSSAMIAGPAISAPGARSKRE